LDALFNLKMLSNTGIQKMADIGLLPFFFLLLVSLFSSLFISHLYLKFYGTKGTGSTLHRSFPLLGVSITAIFVSLQFSIPLSLGLLGSLSIVRFRTPIKDPEEVGFIILVIASSLTCATFNIPFLILIMVVAILGMVILKFDKRLFRKHGDDGMLVVKTSPNVYTESNKDIFTCIKEEVKNVKLDSVVESHDCVLTYKFSSLSEDSIISLRAGLSQIDENIKVSIFVG